MVRLQGGNFSNEGRVEVYCNGQWGTICSTGFGTTDANTICKQLGYDNYYTYNHLSLLVPYNVKFSWPKIFVDLTFFQNSQKLNL